MARRLGYRYLDSGGLYRAIALKVIRAGVDPGDRDGIAGLLTSTTAGYDEEGVILLDGYPEGAALRAPRGGRVRVTGQHPSRRSACG